MVNSLFFDFLSRSLFMRAIPTEMRPRILHDLSDGMTWAATAEKWKISQGFIAKHKRQVRDTGNIAPIQPKTGPKPKLAPYRQLLQKIVAETPDATLAEIQEQLPVSVCLQTIANELIKLKLVYKKNNCKPPNKTVLTSPPNVQRGKSNNPVWTRKNSCF